MIGEGRDVVVAAGLDGWEEFVLGVAIDDVGDATDDASVWIGLCDGENGAKPAWGDLNVVGDKEDLVAFGGGKAIGKDAGVVLPMLESGDVAGSVGDLTELREEVGNSPAGVASVVDEDIFTEVSYAEGANG